MMTAAAGGPTIKYNGFDGPQWDQTFIAASRSYPCSQPLQIFLAEWNDCWDRCSNTQELPHTWTQVQV